MIQQYRLTIEDRSEIIDSYTTEQWSVLTQRAESRGVNIKLETRAIFDFDQLFLDGVKDDSGSIPPGWMILGSKIITNWQYHASVVTHG